MDSINLVKGYGKVHDLELQDQSPNPNTKKYTTKQKSLLTAVSILAIFLMSLTLGSLFGLLVHEYTTEPPESPSSNSADSIIIKAVCNVTRYPDSCFSTITSLSSSSSPKPTDPEAIFKLSIRVSIAELSNFKTIISNSNEAGALGDCQTQIEDALSRLNDSVVAMEVGPGEKVLTESKIKDLQTWISAAMTDQETCLDGLEEMGSTALDEVKTKMQRSKEYISNCLAILANIHTLLHNFHMSLH
jgi:pectinesterase inhibitor-like protein